MLILYEVSTTHHLFISEIKVLSSKEQLNFTTERREGMQNKGALDSVSSYCLSNANV